MFQCKTKIIKNTKINKDCYKISLLAPALAQTAKPGQFIEIKISSGCRPFLRRPFSIHQVEKKMLFVLFKVVGEGTAILAECMPGKELDIIGPLGKGFSLPKGDKYGARRNLLLAGAGIGMAPLLFLAQQAHREKFNLDVLIGARTARDLICIDSFRRFGCQVYCSTDDGSRGFRGKLSGLLQKKLAEAQSLYQGIYACGPRPFLKEVSYLSNKFHIPAQLSLEAHMACGIGACLGCAVTTHGGYKRVCKDGPVFNAEEIIW